MRPPKPVSSVLPSSGAGAGEPGNHGECRGSGLIETDMTAALSEKVRAGAIEHIPLGSFGQPEDVPKQSLLPRKSRLISPASAFVDGGMAM